jgi:hypothetical protein
MFQKLLSNLPFNPSLIGKVSFYAQRLKKEAFIRRLGVVFVLAAIGVQLFAMIAPAKPSLAASANDLKYGGFGSQAQAVGYCQSNGEYQAILAHYGVSCAAIAGGSVQNIGSRDYGGSLLSMGRLPYGIANETAVSVPGVGNYYLRSLWGWDAAGTTSRYNAVVGHRADGSLFMILFDCGNLVITSIPPAQPAPKVISCSNLFMSVPMSSKVPLNTTIKVNGQASGANLPPGELVDMNYDYVTDKGQVLGTAQARGVGFSGSTATDPVQRSFTVTQAGHYFFRVFVKYDGGSKDAVASFACLKDVYVETPPPKPEKQIECTNLIPSFTNGQKVVTGTTVNVRGQASGRNLPEGELVDMYYDYVDVTNKVQGSQKALGVPFKDNTAIDSTPRNFKLEKPGKYTFRLAVKYDGSSKSASGNQTGNCIKVIEVQPPCDQSKHNDETECIILSKKARNDTQQIPDANDTVAHAGDIVTYTLSAKNTSKNTTIKKFAIEESISDILEYADIVDLHGGVKDDRNVVRWPAEDIKAGQTISKDITIRIKNPIPQTPRSSSNPGSFDMTLTNVYGNTVNIKLPPGVTKTTEQVTTSLPNTGPGETIAIGMTVAVVAGYFFARSRLMVKELELVRSDYAVSGGM